MQKFIKGLLITVAVLSLITSVLMLMIAEYAIAVFFFVAGVGFIIWAKVFRLKPRKKREAANKSESRHASCCETCELLGDNERIFCDSWVVLDTETTGLSPQNDRIIEVGARKYINGQTVGDFVTLINPGVKLPKEITVLTGIQPQQLSRAPWFSEIAQRLKEFIGDLPVVAHNAKFDAEFLANEFDRSGISFSIRYIDTVQLARNAFPGFENYKLNTLISKLGLLDHAQDHRALSDVDATAKLYLLCREEIPNRRRTEEQEKEREQLEDKAYHLNQYGMQAESAGNINKAVSYYEDIVSDKACLPNAYIRLAILYKKQKRWEDVIRVCDAALEALPGNPGKLCQPEEYKKRKEYAISKLEQSSADRVQ